MRRGPALGALVAALFLPGAGLAQDIARATAFVEVTRANGCALTEAEAEHLLPAAGLTMDDAQGAALLLNQGELFTVSEDGAALVLVPQLCAAGAEETAALLQAAVDAGPVVRFLPLAERIDTQAGARLIGALRANGCAMHEDQAGDILPGLGFQPETVQDIAALLLEVGMATYQDAALRLDPQLCASAPDFDAEWIGMALAYLADPAPGPVVPDLPGVRAVIALTAMGQGCVIDLADPAATRAVLLGAALARFEIAEPSDEVLAAIAAHIDTTLAAPGPGYTQEPGRLRLIHCTP